MQRVKAQWSVAGEHGAGSDERGRRVLRLEGRLDAAAAARLLARLREVPERDLVIDVGLVRELDEVGVATIARLADASAGPRITLRGLSARQLRILRHLGAGLSQVASANDG